jgi:hypothetical protein
MVTSVPTNNKKNSVTPVSYKRKVRLLLWGGAATPGDNSAFEFAAKSVIRDYNSRDKGNVQVINKNAPTAKDLVDLINAQEDGSIRSLDVFTHGGTNALYFTTASPDTPKLLRFAFHNSSLYRSRAKMVFNAAGWTEGSALVSDIKFSKFASYAKVELHGCKTADTESDGDNIAADLSERLGQAGKTSAIVIGHADKANPNIKGGGEKLHEQDYRHGIRLVFEHGKIARTSKQKGHIEEPKATP